MRKAIITGASGLIGKNVINELLANDIEVLALGRKDRLDSGIQSGNKEGNLTYCQIDLKDINLLPEILKKISWSAGESCVFYHFAWSGSKTLTDGTIDDQLKNVAYSANTIKTAKKIGCIKFVNSGSVEETFAEKYLEHNWKNSEYHSSQSLYSISKLSSRDMCLMVGYLEKIDYVHTRFSAVYNNELDMKGYICSSLKSILNKEEINPPQNNQLFDLINMRDLSKAYYLIGLKGINKADYFIGTGKPSTLSNYFVRLKNSINELIFDEQEEEKISNLILSYEDFDISALTKDTGFQIKNTFLNI
jgi:nucleoside-diphosphate-sugar epimerase